VIDGHAAVLLSLYKPQRFMLRSLHLDDHTTMSNHLLYLGLFFGVLTCQLHALPAVQAGGWGTSFSAWGKSSSSGGKQPNWDTAEEVPINAAGSAGNMSEIDLGAHQAAYTAAAAAASNRPAMPWQIPAGTPAAADVRNKEPCRIGSC
jgi:hypothetical protein